MIQDHMSSQPSEPGHRASLRLRWRLRPGHLGTNNADGHVLLGCLGAGSLLSLGLSSVQGASVSRRNGHADEACRKPPALVLLAFALLRVGGGIPEPARAGQRAPPRELRAWRGRNDRGPARANFLFCAQALLQGLFWDALVITWYPRPRADCPAGPLSRPVDGSRRRNPRN